MRRPPNHASIVLRATRLFTLSLLLTSGVLTSCCLLPFFSDDRRKNIRATWSALLVRVMGIRIEADMRHADSGSLIVANHISWIDIFVINAIRPSCFVAKEEIKRWPVFGWLASQHDTLFIQRGSALQARLANERIASLLGKGKTVVIFPEGTTTDGQAVLPFRPALLQSALDASRPIVPTSISYWEPDGQISLAPRYDGNVSFYDCLKAVISRRRLVARLTTKAALRSETTCEIKKATRQQMAEAARQAILSFESLPAETNAPLTEAHQHTG